MNDKRFNALRYLSIALFVAVLGVCIPFVKWGDLDPARTFGLVAILAVFETWRIQFPWGRPLRLGMAAVLCIIAIRPLPEVVFIFLLGSLLGRAFTRVQRSGGGDFLHIVQRTYIVALSGVVVKQAQGVLRVVSEGGGMRQFGPYVRKVCLAVARSKTHSRGSRSGKRLQSHMRQ